MSYKSKSLDYTKMTLVSSSYILYKRIIKEAEDNIIKRDEYKLEVANIVCTHIENVINNLDEKNKIIIENEVIHGKTGRWYEEFFSTPSYYRHRKVAYKVFLNDLEK